MRVLLEESSMSTSRRRFTQEFKDELCCEVISTSEPIKEVALAYGVGPETLRNWLIKYRQANGGTETELTKSVEPVSWHSQDRSARDGLRDRSVNGVSRGSSLRT